SSRVEFPRREPVVSGEPEWMTVRLSTGEVSAGQGPPPPPPPLPGPGGAGGGGGGGGGLMAMAETETLAGGAGELRRRLWQERVPLAEGGWEERVTWEEVSASELPEHHTSWSWEGDTE